jgi:hypothetical protein
VAIMLGLRTISDTKELTADVLLKMMSASRRRAPVVFTYSETRTRTEACVVLRNSSLTGQILRDEINRIAIAARDEATIWSAGKPDSAEKSESKPEQTPNTEDAAPPTTPEPAPSSKPELCVRHSFDQETSKPVVRPSESLLSGFRIRVAAGGSA